MRIIDPENVNALFDPKVEDVLQLGPERLPVLGLKIERINILVFFGRILGVLNGAVGPFAKPLRMLANVRVIRGALESDVERDFEATFAGAFYECAKIIEGTKFEVDRFVAAFGRADCPRAARIIWSR